MTKSWRPEGWLELGLGIYGEPCLDWQAGYEAGADAMLEALKCDGSHFVKGEWTDDATFETEVPGTIVFIPDGEK